MPEKNRLKNLENIVEPARDFSRRAEIKQGWKTVAPASAAVAPLALALGMLVSKSGFAWWWAPIIAAIVFAGSMEFLLVGLLTAIAPLTQIALSTLLVNFRHVFYALSFPLHRVRGVGWKTYSTYAITDEVYALAANPHSHRWSRAKIISVQLIFHTLWVACVTVGAGIGTLIPPWIQGLEFAVTALFVVLAMEAFAVRRSIPVPVLALLCGLVALLVSPEHMLIIAMSFFVGGLIAAYFWKRHKRA